MTEPRGRPSLRERFPAVRLLERRGGRSRVPYVQQLHLTDCGAACLAMVLRYFGRHAPLEEIRERMSASRDGVSALAVLDAARAYGLRGRAVRLEIEDLDCLPTGSILHWRMNHFVVLDRITRRGVEIVDPAIGRRVVPRDEFSRSFTGVAIEFEPTEAFVTGRPGRSRVWRYARKVLAHSRLLSKVLLTSLFVQAIALALPVLTGTIVDRVVPRGDASLLFVISAGIAMITVFSFVASFLRAHLLLHLRTNLDLRLTVDFLDHLMSLPFSFFQRRQTGDLMMRLNSNAVIRETLTGTALSGLLDGLIVSSYLLLLMLTHPGLGIVVVGLGLLRVTIFLGTRHRYRELMSESLQAQADASNFQVQMIEGIETLKSAGVERRAIESWSNLFVSVMNVSLKRGRLSAVVDSTLGALGFASPLILLGYGGHLVLQGQLTLGTMLAMNALAAGFLTPLSSLVQTALQFQVLQSYVERVDEVLVKKPEQTNSDAATAPPLEGRIELRGVSFRYAKAAPLVVEDVDLQVPQGSQIAIVGRSGSGKSTLARLLVRLYEPEAGSILYDDLDLSRFELGSVRRQIGFVPQYPFLFASSIRSNIAMGDPGVPLPEVQRAAELAYIHDEIMEMPLKYETPVASGGGSLSGGQRQRVALARALLRHAPILVLDEATSHLDTLAERRIHENLRELSCTRVVIAHRLSTVVDSDLIVVMEEGRIVEEGTHDLLLEKGGHYAELFRNQGPER